jgi:hypothetical protein
MTLGLVSAAWAAVIYYATYKLDGGTSIQSDQNYTATATDTSGVRVTNSDSLTLTNSKITTSGNTSSQGNSNFYGLNAGVLATAGGKIDLSKCIITTSGIARSSHQ